MKQQKKFCATLQGKGKTIEVSLAVLFYQEDKIHFAYCPTLDIYGYGENEQEAKDSFEVNVSEFFRYTLNKGTLYEVLKSLGWKIRRGKIQKITPPTVEQLVARDNDYSNILQTRSVRQVFQNIAIPAC